MNRKLFLQSLLAAPLVTLSLRSKSENDFMVMACKTARDMEGPFYKDNAPFRNIIKAEGIPLTVSGTVIKADDCKTPIANAVIDIWHCNNAGDYDMQGYNCRAQLRTDKNGAYSFSTIVPPPYGGRPRHIHFKIRAEGFSELTTQMYFEGDRNIQNDFARNAGKDRVIALSNDGEAKKGVFNIFL